VAVKVVLPGRVTNFEVDVQWSGEHGDQETRLAPPMKLRSMDPWTLDTGHTRAGDDDAEEEGGLPRRHQTLQRLLEQAREEWGSPPLWDVVAARLDEGNRRRDAVARMLDTRPPRSDSRTGGRRDLGADRRARVAFVA
jgi:hypothetical protein